MNVDLGGWSFGAQFGDLNNDGSQDLYLVNGYVSASRTESYWYDYSKVAGGHEVVISDAKNWPAMGTRSLAGYQAKRVWVNDGAGRLVDVAQMVGVADRHDGRSVALADFANRGMLDVVVANQRGPLLLYRNDVAPGRGWIALRPRGQLPSRYAGEPALHEPQRDRRTGHAALAGPAAGAGGARQLRLLCPEPASAALRARARPRPSTGRSSAGPRVRCRRSRIRRSIRCTC